MATPKTPKVNYKYRQTGLALRGGDANAVTLKLNETLTAARILNLITGDADRTITLSGNPTLDDWFDQSVKSGASPSFVALTVSGAAAGITFSGSGNHDITASSGTLRFGAATLTGTLTYTGQTITGGTLASSTINNTNTITCKAGSSFTLQDPSVTSKQAQFSLSSITSGQTRTYTLQNTTGTLAQLNIAQTFTQNLTFNNGFTSYGFGASFQNGGLSFGELDDTTTTGSDVEVDNTSTKDYPQRIFKNASLSSIKGITMGNSFFLVWKNQTGANVTFKNNASVSALVSQINTGYGADLVVQDGRWIAFSFNIDTQKVDVIGGTFNTPTLSDVSVSGNITLGTDKVLLAKPSTNTYSPPSGYGYYSGDTMYLKGTVGGSYNDPTALLYNTGKSGAGTGYWFTNAAATGNDDANSLVLIDAGFTIRAQFYDAGNWKLSGSGEVTGELKMSSTTKAFIPPKVTTTQKNAISSPSGGMVVFDTTLNKLCVYGASSWETVTSV